MRRVLILAIVGSWLIMLAALVRKSAPPDMAELAALPGVHLEERDEWFGVYRNGDKVGHAHRVTARTASGYSFFEDSVVALAMLGVPQTIRTSLAAETDPLFALSRFRFRLISPATVFSATGNSDGHQLTVTYGPQGQHADLTVPLEEPIYLPITLRSRLLAGDPAVGTRYQIPVFSPLALRNQPMSVTIDGRERLTGPNGPVETIRLSEEQGGIRTRAWLDQQGEVVREEGVLGFTLERETREQAVAGITGGVPVDLAASSRIPLQGRIEDPRRIDRLTLRVRGAARDRIPNDPPRQRIRADLLQIVREDLPSEPPFGPSRPHRPHTSEGVGPTGAKPVDTALAPYLAPAPLIESDDPVVVAQARAIVGDAPDNTTAARLLVSWVHQHLTKMPTVTVPSAREVLASQRGDCNEHAVLLTALARAAGIPARIVAGATYAEDAFYYHAWTELWLGRWVSADGVFGQIPVDATHVKLVEGGIDRYADLVGVVGELAFAVEEDPR